MSPKPVLSMDAGRGMMRGRPPLTVLAYIGVIVFALVVGSIEFGARPAWLLGCVLLVGIAVGLYLGVRLAWILVTVVQLVNAVGLLATARWSAGAFHAVLLALLLAPPSRRHFRRDPSRPQRAGSQASRTCGCCSSETR